MARSAKFRVEGMLEGRYQSATVTVNRSASLISVRPLHRHRVYELPLADVAEMIIWRIALAERREKLKAKRLAKQGG